MGVWMGERERDQAAGSGAHYLHGNLYHWEKKKKIFQCGKQAGTVLWTQKKNCSTHRRPQRAQ